jgi:hypothetical protein
MRRRGASSITTPWCLSTFRRKRPKRAELPRVVDLSYASPLGGRVPAYLVRPRRGGAATAAAVQAATTAPAACHPAAVLVNPGQGNHGTFLDEEVDLGGRSLVSLPIGAPSTRPDHPNARSSFDAEQDRRDFVQAAIDLRRGFDLLAARDDYSTCACRARGKWTSCASCPPPARCRRRRRERRLPAVCC